MIAMLSMSSFGSFPNCYANYGRIRVSGRFRCVDESLAMTALCYGLLRVLHRPIVTETKGKRSRKLRLDYVPGNMCSNSAAG